MKPAVRTDEVTDAELDQVFGGVEAICECSSSSDACAGAACEC